MAKWNLIHEKNREAIKRQLDSNVRHIEDKVGYSLHHADEPKLALYLMESPPSIQLPEIHTFMDADGFEFVVCGWDEKDAEKHLKESNRARFPVVWQGAATAWPGLYVVCTGRREYRCVGCGVSVYDGNICDDCAKDAAQFN